jgi:hypothetical protein
MRHGTHRRGGPLWTRGPHRLSVCPPENFCLAEKAPKRGRDHVRRRNVAAAEFVVVDVVSRPAQFACGPASAALDRKNRVCTSMRDEKPRRVFLSGGRYVTRRKPQSVADELAINESEREGVRAAVGKACERPASTARFSNGWFRARSRKATSGPYSRSMTSHVFLRESGASTMTTGARRSPRSSASRPSPMRPRRGT